ncbi:MAG: ABC-2 type transporter, partial [Haloquadratum sp. J07HQX50]
LPLLFLSETFIPPALLPGWFQPLLGLSPLTYVVRGIRAVTYTDASTEVIPNLAIIMTLAAGGLLLGALAVPQAE